MKFQLCSPEVTNAATKSGASCKEVDPRSRWIEENDAVPDDLVQKSRELGLFGLTIPEQYGGIGLNLAGKCAIEEEMGQTNYGFATLIGNHTGIGTTGIVALGNGSAEAQVPAAHGDRRMGRLLRADRAARRLRSRRRCARPRSRKATATS